jgi:23S rRNA (uracil1939-C5)-methyltransferase
MSFQHQPGGQVTFLISGISHEGAGIGRDQGLAVFVPGALPGDQVTALIEKRRSRFATGKLIEILQPSANRIQPACSVASACGGCTLQHLAYSAQLHQKEQIVFDALQRIGRITDPSPFMRPIIGMNDPWHYRNNAQLLISGDSSNPRIGFAAVRSHRAVPSAICPVLPPVCDRIRDAVRLHIQKHAIEPYDEEKMRGLLRRLIIRTALATGEVMVILEINGDSLPAWEELNAALSLAAESECGISHLAGFLLAINPDRSTAKPARQAGGLLLLSGKPWIEEQILGVRYRISAQAFFQINPRQAAHLFTVIREMAGLTGQENVLDLYCGTGAVALQLSPRARQVVGIEICAAAVEDAKMNAALNGFRNTRFLAGCAETLLPQLIQEGLTADCVILDPPRSGCAPSLLVSLAQLKPTRIVYTSCDPATLARDIALLQPEVYTVKAVQPVDMFPWTGHVETVVLMSKDAY